MDIKKKFLICRSGGNGRIIEKKSEFIGEIIPARSEAEAQAFIDSRRKQYWDARHHCYAYITEDGTKFSDDGEPAQTAGKPMMDILENAGVHDLVLVVTRYFGGTLLGTGGLVRAYQAAAKAALENCELAECLDGVELTYELPYDLYGTLQRMNANIVFSEFAECVKIRLVVPCNEKDNFMKKISEASNGNTLPLDEKPIKLIKINDRIEVL